MRSFRASRDLTWHIRSLGPVVRRNAIPRPTPPSCPCTPTALSRRAFHTTCPRSAWRRPGFQFRFRPVPSYALLLAAQLYLIYVLTRDLSNVEDNVHGDESSLLNTSNFTPYTLVKKETVSPNSFILTLAPTPIVSDKGRRSASWWARARNLGKPSLKRQKQKLKEYQDALWRQGIWSVEIKQPQLMIARRYTPLPPDVDVNPVAPLSPSPATAAGAQDRYGTKPTHPNPDPIRLFVRREPQGEVSRFLHSLPEGATVELRGGFAEYKIPQDVQDVVFIAGGTGIAPALAVANALAARRDANDGARFCVLWANRRREDCVGARTGGGGGLISSLMRMAGVSSKSEPGSGTGAQSDGGGGREDAPGTLVRQLRNMQTMGEGKGELNLVSRYFVDEEGTFVQRADIADALEWSAAKTAKQESGFSPHRCAKSRRRLLLVSGPDGFVEYIAGPKILRNGVEVQGPVRGLLSGFDLSGWEVWKL